MTNEGDISVADWVHSWNKMHGDLSSDSFAWDKFAANMASFFTSDVSPFIERLEANGVAYLARKYKHKSDADAWVYSIFVNVPHSAHLVEVTATAVQDAHHDLFEELSPSMCQTAMRLTQPAADLTTLWSELGDVDEDAGGLPSLLAVSVMVPTSSPKDVERFLRKYGRNEVSHCNAKSSWPCGSFLAAVFFQNTGEPLPKFLRIIGARALRSRPLPSPSPWGASA